MTEMDWANEIADEMLSRPCTCNSCLLVAIPAALRAAERRGRAMGMREAAEMIKTKLLAGDFLEDTDVTFAVLDVSVAASKLDSTD